MANTKRVFQAEITGVKLISFSQQEAIDLLPQMGIINVYEGIFEPLVKAEIFMTDHIGLFVNFPLTGEEFIVLSYRPTSDKENAVEYDRVFVINAVTAITPKQNARGYKYCLHLVSRLAYENSRVKVSQAYPDGGGGTISDFAESLFDKYLVKPAKKLSQLNPFASELIDNYNGITEVEETTDSHTVVIPNLRPIPALQWLARKAVSANNTQHYVYTFYETLDGFKFKTVQDTILDPAKREAAKQDPYYFVADIKIVEGKELKIGGMSVYYDPRKSIANFVTNKRYSTMDKIVRGHFENTYFELNLYENSYRATDTYNDESIKTIDVGKLNTRDYIEAASANNMSDAPNLETRNRVYYAFNNQNSTDPQSGLYDYDKKFGPMTISQVGFDQVDIHITLEGDTNRKAGDIVYCLFPEMHGFNIVGQDKLISGYYIVTEVKHSFSIGSTHSMVLRINKDSYLTDLDACENMYGTSNEILNP